MSERWRMTAIERAVLDVEELAAGLKTLMEAGASESVLLHVADEVKVRTEILIEDLNLARPSTIPPPENRDG